MNPTCTSRRPPSASASATARLAAAVVASGFSHSTGLPASMQASTKSACVASEEAISTASTSSERISDSGSTCISTPSPATARARTRSTSDTATTSAAGTCESVCRCPAPITPRPIMPIRTATSDRRREVHVAAVVARVLRLLGPARGDRLPARVEADALCPVDVVIAEQRVLPAAEAVEGHRDRDRDVDPDHPDLDLALEDPRHLPAAREDRAAVGVGVAVDEIDCSVERVDAHDGEHGPEDLVGVDGHVGRDVVEQRRADPEAVPLERELAAV